MGNSYKLLFIQTFYIIHCFAFIVPDIKLEVLRPKGFKVSIADEEGIKLFAFHAKLNEELNGREGGTFSRDVLKPKNGFWTFYEPNIKLNVGDILYYWTYVDYFDGVNKLGYTNDDRMIKVEENHIVDGPTETPSTKKTTSKPTTSKSCELSLTSVKGRKKCKNALIFSDQFKTLDKKKWKTELRFAGEPDYEFVVYTDNVQVLNTESGKLRIKPYLSEEILGNGFVTSTEEFNFGEECTGELDTAECIQKAEAYLIKPPVASAKISTKDSFSFKYGTVEIKAKLPKGDWIYPELYLNPVTEEYGSYYESGQIRIAFCQGNDNLDSVLYGGCILGSSNLARNKFIKNIKKTGNNSWTDTFNIFSLTWADDKIALSVNGKKYGTIYAPEEGFASLKDELSLTGTNRWKKSNSLMAPFDQEMYITVGVGVGGHNFVDKKNKPWINNDPKSQKNFFKRKDEWYNTWKDESVLEVEYIKVFALGYN